MLKIATSPIIAERMAIYKGMVKTISSAVGFTIFAYTMLNALNPSFIESKQMAAFWMYGEQMAYVILIMGALFFVPFLRDLLFKLVNTYADRAFPYGFEASIVIKPEDLEWNRQVGMTRFATILCSFFVLVALLGETAQSRFDEMTLQREIEYLHGNMTKLELRIQQKAQRACQSSE